MATATASITLGNPVTAPSLGGLVAQLIDTNNVTVDHQNLDATATDTIATATFLSVAPGTYTVAVARVDGAGASVAPAAISAAFTIEVPTTVSVTVPTGVAVTVN